MDHKFPRQGSAKYSTWFWTLRPLGGIDARRIKLIEEHLMNHRPWFLLVTEGNGDQLHCHVLEARHTACTRSNVIRSVLDLKGMDLTAEEASAFRARNYKGQANPQIWYNWDVAEEYLAKDPYRRIICSQLPPLCEREEWAKHWFPIPTDQRLERGPNTNAEWRRIRNLWHEYSTVWDEEKIMKLDPIPLTETTCIKFFYKMQREDKMRATIDPRIMQQRVRWFTTVYMADEIDVPGAYVGSESKRLKTAQEEDEAYCHRDMSKNPHLYTDSEDRMVVDKYYHKFH